MQPGGVAEEIAVAVLDAALRYRSANRAYRRLVGAEAELGGRAHQALVRGAPPARGAARLREVLATGQPWRTEDFCADVLGTAASGGWEAEALPLAAAGTGAVDAVVLVARRANHVDERARAEATLHEHAEHFRLLVESATDHAIVAMSAMRIVTTWNRGAERLLGWRAGEIIGRSGDVFFDRSDVARAVPAREAAHAFATGSAGNERWHVRKDGSRFWGSGLMTPLRDGAGEIRGLVKIFRDMTAAKAAAEERERLLADAELARRDAERANAAKDEFLAVLSHELRSPLNAMLGWAHLLTRAAPDNPMVLRAAETLERNIRAQAQMVSDLLDVSRIASGKIRLEHERIDVPALVAAAVESLRPSADAKGVALDVELAPDPLEVSGDPARLQQIVGNLAGNAIKFTPAGGRVVVRVRAAGAAAEIEVEDTGAGIAPEFLPHVFDRFVQFEPSTTRRHGGLGLGLAIVRDLTALHGGSVRVASAGVGRGARFTVALPAVESATHAAAGTTPSPPADLPALDVLLVEDDDDTRAALEAVLECAGARVRAAASAQEALAAYGARRPDVIVSDIGMPGRDGYELVRAIRAREAEAGPRTPAVALTGFASGGDRDAALAAGYDRHLAKPVGPTALLACIRELRPRRA